MDVKLLTRCALIAFCCGVALTAEDRGARLRLTAKPILRSARTEPKPAGLHEIAAELRDAGGLPSGDENLVAAISALERQAHEIKSPSLRATFAGRARALLELTSDIQIMRGRPVAALWYSDRAREVAMRTFTAVPADETADTEQLGYELVKRVPSDATAIHQDLRTGQLLTWVIHDGQVHFVTTPIAAATVEAELTRFRALPSVLGAKELYRVLLRPVERYLAGTHLLVYSPAPALRGVPFAALHDGESFLIQRRPVAVTPSLNTFIDRWRQRSAPGGGAVLITLPAPARNSPVLAGAREEMRALLELYGARATKSIDEGAAAFLAKIPAFDTIHVTTHGYVDPEPLQSGIEFGSDRLMALEITSRVLARRPVVILAGCRTSDETAGRTLMSLSSAFLAAGASAVVGSLWDIEDQSAARLMIEFHRHRWANVSPAESLARAQQSAIARNESIALWAAFQVQM